MSVAETIQRLERQSHLKIEVGAGSPPPGISFGAPVFGGVGHQNSSRGFSNTAAFFLDTVKEQQTPLSKRPLGRHAQEAAGHELKQERRAQQQHEHELEGQEPKLQQQTKDDGNAEEIKQHDDCNTRVQLIATSANRQAVTLKHTVLATTCDPHEQQQHEQHQQEAQPTQPGAEELQDDVNDVREQLEELQGLYATAQRELREQCAKTRLMGKQLEESLAENRRLASALSRVTAHSASKRHLIDPNTTDEVQAPQQQQHQSLASGCQRQRRCSEGAQPMLSTDSRQGPGQRRGHSASHAPSCTQAADDWSAASMVSDGTLRAAYASDPRLPALREASVMSGVDEDDLRGGSGDSEHPSAAPEVSLSPHKPRRKRGWFIFSRRGRSKPPKPTDTPTPSPAPATSEMAGLNTSLQQPATAASDVSHGQRRRIGKSCPTTPLKAGSSRRTKKGRKQEQRQCKRDRSRGRRHSTSKGRWLGHSESRMGAESEDEWDNHDEGRMMEFTGGDDNGDDKDDSDADDDAAQGSGVSRGRSRFRTYTTSSSRSRSMRRQARKERKAMEKEEKKLRKEERRQKQKAEKLQQKKAKHNSKKKSKKKGKKGKGSGTTDDGEVGHHNQHQHQQQQQQQQQRRGRSGRSSSWRMRSFNLRKRQQTLLGPVAEGASVPLHGKHNYRDRDHSDAQDDDEDDDVILPRSLSTGGLSPGRPRTKSQSEVLVEALHDSLLEHEVPPSPKMTRAERRRAKRIEREVRKSQVELKCENRRGDRRRSASVDSNSGSGSGNGHGDDGGRHGARWWLRRRTASSACASKGNSGKVLLRAQSSQALLQAQPSEHESQAAGGISLQQVIDECTAEKNGSKGSKCDVKGTHERSAANQPKKQGKRQGKRQEKRRGQDSSSGGFRGADGGREGGAGFSDEQPAWDDGLAPTNSITRRLERALNMSPNIAAIANTRIPSKGTFKAAGGQVDEESGLVASSQLSGATATTSAVDGGSESRGCSSSSSRGSDSGVVKVDSGTEHPRVCGKLPSISAAASAATGGTAVTSGVSDSTAGSDDSERGRRRQQLAERRAARRRERKDMEDKVLAEALAVIQGLEE